MKSPCSSRVVLIFVVALTFCVPSYAAQNPPLALGSWTTPLTLPSCPDQFYPSTCFSTQISCPNAATVTATYGYTVATPSKGTIVIFSGGGGTTAAPEEYEYAQDYNRAIPIGYTVVQVIWSSDWESAPDPGGQQLPYNMKTAACRPATFLQFVYTNPAMYRARTGFCAQGASGGAAAVGYSLAWYGAATGTSGYPRLDNAELIDGPIFSDLQQGCAEYNGNDSPDITVCGPGTTQLGCNGWPSNGVTITPEFVFGAERGIQQWTGDPTCAVGPTTSDTSNDSWLGQSIVSPNASFTYPTTTIAGWLCASVLPPPNKKQPNCADNSNGQYCLNNTTSQGQLFFANFINPDQLYAIPALTAVTQCAGSEGVGTGMAPNGEVAHVAIVDDMTTNCQYHQ